MIKKKWYFLGKHSVKAGESGGGGLTLSGALQKSTTFFYVAPYWISNFWRNKCSAVNCLLPVPQFYYLFCITIFLFFNFSNQFLIWWRVFPILPAGSVQSSFTYVCRAPFHEKTGLIWGILYLFILLFRGIICTKTECLATLLSVYVHVYILSNTIYCSLSLHGP